MSSLQPSIQQKGGEFSIVKIANIRKLRATANAAHLTLVPVQKAS
jgi:hypothetical protein